MSELCNIPVEDVLPNPDQPRVEFDAVEIESLAESIRAEGLVQPIVVEQNDGHYVLIDGERRLRAVKHLGWANIRAVVHTYDEKPVNRLTQAVVANLQRADLNPIEEAQAFKKMVTAGMKQYEIAQVVGRSGSHVSFRIKLLEFEPEIQQLFAARKLPIDPVLIGALFKLPADVRVSLCVKSAAKGTPASSIMRMVNKYSNRAELPDVPLTGRKRAPAAIMSNVPEENRMMALVDDESGLLDWELINQAAHETCRDCSLNNLASTQMCKDCSAVELLKRLNRILNSTSN
jgi:ParB family chromosome partitioning protein